MMPVNVVNLTYAAMDARREVWPSIQYGQFSFSGMNVGDANWIKPGVMGISEPDGDKWQITSKAVFGFSISCDVVGGASLVAHISVDDTFFRETFCWKIPGELDQAMCSGFELAGWSARFQIISNGTDATVRGLIYVRAL